MAKICRYTPECNVIALILLIRFFAYQPSLKLTDRTWRRYLLTALMISQVLGRPVPAEYRFHRRVALRLAWANFGAGGRNAMGSSF